MRLIQAIVFTVRLLDPQKGFFFFFVALCSGYPISRYSLLMWISKDITRWLPWSQLYWQTELSTNENLDLFSFSLIHFSSFFHFSFWNEEKQLLSSYMKRYKWWVFTFKIKAGGHNGKHPFSSSHVPMNLRLPFLILKVFL